MPQFKSGWCLHIVSRLLVGTQFSRCGSLAQLGEHLPYKQRVTGSSPVTSTKYGPVVQLVRTLACHARGRRFDPDPGRHIYASVAQSVEQGTENPRVDGSIPSEGTTEIGCIIICWWYSLFVFVLGRFSGGRFASTVCMFDLIHIFVYSNFLSYRKGE